MTRARILDGKSIAKQLRLEVKAEVDQFIGCFSRPPSLHVIVVGNNPASQIYVRNKQKAATSVGIHSMTHALHASVSQRQVQQLVSQLSQDPLVDAILVQLPLVEGLNETSILDRLDPQKDVDGLHPINMGLLTAGRQALVPCTPQGCMRLIREAGIQLEGKRALVIGRSLLMGKPAAQLLLAEHATVTIAHSRTQNLQQLCAQSDVVIAAAGKAELVQGSWLRPGAVVIDVGINRRDDGSIVGDVDFEQASKVAAAISPVPGGVGPLTIGYLLRNTVVAATHRMRSSDDVDSWQEGTKEQ